MVVPRSAYLTLLAVPLVFTACASGRDTAWVKPPAGDQPEVRRDTYECKRDAAMLPLTLRDEPLLGLMFGNKREELFRECMASKGYAEQRGARIH
jgi:hypothetical protein